MFVSKPKAPKQSRSGILPPVFYPAAILIGVVVIVTMLFHQRADTFFSALQGWVGQTFGWLYILSVALYLVFALWLAFSRFGDIKLGPDHATPDYSFTAWFAMLFSAGMGIGLMFYSVAEPIMHFTNPPVGEPETLETAAEAMKITYFHWGIHAWAIYAVVGMALAYFGFRHKMPLTLSSALYPLVGDRIYGPLGHVIDVFAVLGTMFGVATSLGVGVTQVNGGLNFLLGVPIDESVQVLLIALITMAATASVVAGLDAGIRRLSELNLILAGLLLLFVISVGPTLVILDAYVENTGNYLSAIVERTFRLSTYDDADQWMSDWTLFYWGWWISWSPFVGMFIARVSRGRTIREFVTGVLVVPPVLTFLWMTTFGNSALHMEMSGMGAGIIDAVDENVALALFQFLDQLPLSSITSVLAMILVMTFFVTSSDSGSLVIDTITSGGALHPPVWQRVFWAVSEGAVAAALLLGGGLGALQAAAITTALPFTIVVALAGFGVIRGLKMEAYRDLGDEVAPRLNLFGGTVSWRHRLRSILAHPKRADVLTFMNETVEPALKQVAEEIQQHGWTTRVNLSEKEVELVVEHGGEVDFRYAILLRACLSPDFAFPEMDPDMDDAPSRYYRAEVHLLTGGQQYNIYGYTKEEVITDVLTQYNKHMHFLHLAR
ncbi:BCCT family transporter [Yunchengibacter salinarum]|uniref:BCCT family transporter n=1 Tax=Yunchengibacter salinarum TaxID=3133399 RepID=UPI0035B676DC